MTPRRTGKRYIVVGTGGVGERIIAQLHERGEKELYSMDKRIKGVLDKDHFIQRDVPKWIP
jgi:homoserine dehydrogenase